MKLELIIGEALAGFAAGFYNGIARDRKINFELELAEELRNKDSVLREVFQDSPEFDKLCSEKNVQFLHKLYSTSQITFPLVMGMVIGGINYIAKQGFYAFPVGLLAFALPSYLGGFLGELISKTKRKKAKLSKNEIELLEFHIKNYRQKIIRDEDPTEAETKLVSYLEVISLKKRNIELLKPALYKINDSILYAENYKQSKN